MRWRGACLPLLAITVIFGAVGCESAATPSGPATPPPAASPASTGPGGPSATPTSTPTAKQLNCPGGWRTGPLTVARKVGVPPVPVATGIRIGTHSDCRFDRLVIDVSGAQPGYAVTFVTRVIRDGSGQIVTMPGSTYLVIRLTPTQGHRADGTGELSQSVRAVDYPMLRSYAVTGDFEGVLSVALGLADGTRYRVGELPGRIYLDVAW